MAEQSTWVYPLTPFSEEYIIRELENKSESQKEAEKEKKPQTPAEEEETECTQPSPAILPTIEHENSLTDDTQIDVRNDRLTLKKLFQRSNGRVHKSCNQ